MKFSCWNFSCARIDDINKFVHAERFYFFFFFLKNRGRSFSNSFFRIYRDTMRDKREELLLFHSFILSSKFTNSIFHNVFMLNYYRIWNLFKNFCTKIFYTCIKSRLAHFLCYSKIGIMINFYMQIPLKIYTFDDSSMQRILQIRVFVFESSHRFVDVSLYELTGQESISFKHTIHLFQPKKEKKIKKHGKLFIQSYSKNYPRSLEITRYLARE